jgi:preprotein translocase subunit SecF
LAADTLSRFNEAQNPEELRRDEPRIAKALAPLLGVNAQDAAVARVRRPVIGEELRRNAILGVLLGVGLIAVWLYIRYNFAGNGVRYAVAGIVALVHDVLVLVGLFALLEKSSHASKLTARSLRRY